jgi:hypothetical protein
MGITRTAQRQFNDGEESKATAEAISTEFLVDSAGEDDRVSPSNRLVFAEEGDYVQLIERAVAVPESGAVPAIFSDETMVIGMPGATVYVPREERVIYVADDTVLPPGDQTD